MAVDDGLKEKVGSIEFRDNEVLSLVVRLSTFFSVKPEDDRVYIIVCCPPSEC